MKASLKFLVLGLFLLVPFATAQAQAPSLSPIPSVTVNAGATAIVNVVAVDASGRQINLTHSLPSFGTLNTPTTGIGVVSTTLTLSPGSINVGNYTAAVTATAGGVSDIKIFQIMVNPAGSNQAPVVNAPALREVTAGSNLTFSITVSDPDGDAIGGLEAEGIPSGATFTPNGSNTSAVFNWTPGAGDVGEYDLLVMAMNALSGMAVTHIRVASAPVLTITPIDDVTVAGGSSASVPVHASGPAGEMITLTAALPPFATLNPPGTGTGSVSTTISVNPPVGSAGTYHSSVTATSVSGFVTESFDIIVTGAGGGENHAPVLTAPASETVAVGSALSFSVTATDPDGDHVNLFGSALPPGSGFIDSGDNSGTFAWSPVSGQAGSYTASFSGLDNRGGSGSASTSITVTGGVVENHAPTLSAPLTETVAEGVHLSFTVTATDQDGDHVALSANGTPSGATFSDQANNTGIFSWTPGSTQSGDYNVAFSGNDGNGGTGTASTAITVTDVPPENHAPVVSAPSTEQVDEGVNLAFTVTATDQDGDHVALSAGSTPSGATFSDLGNNSGAFSWTPGSTQSGVYNVVFEGNDGHGGTGTANTAITVNDVGGGGGGEVPGKACLIASFQSKSGSTCFRIRPVNGSFNLRDVVLSSITFVFHGASVAALSDGSRIELQCHGHHGDDGEDDDQGENGDGDHGNGHHDAAAIYLSGDHHGEDQGEDDGDDDDHGNCGGIVCGEHGGNDNRPTGNDGATCDTLGIRACFSTQALREVLAGAKMPCDLVNAEIHATLTNGAIVVATFGNGHHDDGDDDKDKDKDKDKNKDKGRCKMNTSIRPNPLNPKADLSFTMAREGRVRVAVYDMRGRLVKILLDEFRAVGEQKLMWDGSNAQSQKVASGVYFFRIQAPEGDVIQRVAVVK